MQLGVMFGGQALGGVGMRMLTLGASVAGSLLFGKKKEPVNKLNDVRVSSSSYGRGIPKVWGTTRVTGNIFWSTQFEEVKRVMSAKGKEKTGKKADKKVNKGKADEVYEYYANFAVGLALGPMDDVIRIWADNNLIYNKLNPEDEDIVTVGFSQGEPPDGKASKSSGKGGKKGGDGESGRFQFRFYSGSENQMPDSFMIEKQGDQVPAFRGLCYLMFEHFSLMDFGNRIPTITAEITQKEDRLPEVQAIENLPGSSRLAYEGTADRGWIAPSFDTFYVEARDDLNRRVIRYYDIAKNAEVRVIDFDPVTSPYFPQEVPTYTPSLGFTSVTVSEAPHRLLGIDAKGQLVGQRGGPNFGQLVWFDPNTLRGLGVHGKSSIFGFWGDELLEQTIFVAISHYILPVISQGDFSLPEVMNVVVGVTNAVHVFDDQYESQALFRFDFGSISNSVNDIIWGQYKEKAGIYMSVYPAPYRGSLFFEEVPKKIPGTLGVYNRVSEPIYSFPEDGTMAGGEYVSCEKLAYNVALESIVMLFYQSHDIIGSDGTTVYPKGLWAVLYDGYENQEIKRFRCGDSDNLPSLFFRFPQILTGYKYSWVSGGNKSNTMVHTIDFSAGTYNTFSTAGMLPRPITGQYYWSSRDAIIYMTDDVDVDADDDRWVYVYLDRKKQGALLISDICEDLVQEAGIPQDQVDVSEMGTQEIIGYSVENPTEIRSILQELSTIFQFDVVESDYTLKFLRRGRPHVTVINQDELGVVTSEFGETENDYYVETRMQPIELPERVTFSYINPKEDYEVRSAHFKRPVRPNGVITPNEHLELNVNMAMKGTVAKELSRQILFAAWNESVSHQLNLARDYLWLDPTDTVRVYLENGELFEDRITDFEVGANYEIEVQSVSQQGEMFSFPVPDGNGGFIPYDPDANPNGSSVYSVPAENDVIGSIVPIYKEPAPSTRAALFNLPYLSDEDVDEQSGFVYYYGLEALSEGFRFGTVFRKESGNTEEVGGTTHDILWGYVDTTPPPPESPDIIDYETVIKLFPAFDYNAIETVYPWESIADEDWPNATNMIVIGNEVILFKEVVENPDGSVEISTLVRGYKGTINAAYQHHQTEKYYLVTERSFREERTPLDDIGITYNYYSTSLGRSIFLPAQIPHILDGSTKKPLPVGAVYREESSGDIEIYWERSTRYDGGLKSGSGSIPLNEETEEYQIYLLKDPYDATTWDPENTDMYHIFKGGLTDSNTIFTSAELSAEGLTSDVDIHIVIYQMSTSIGRGFPRGLTLNYSLYSFI